MIGLGSVLNGIVIGGDLDIGEFWGVELNYGVSIKLVAREKLLSGAISYTTPTVRSPLRKKDAKWRWTKVEQGAIKKLKEILCSNKVLTFYDPEKCVKLDTDASFYGLGAVLSHVDSDGNE